MKVKHSMYIEDDALTKMKILALAAGDISTGEYTEKLLELVPNEEYERALEFYKKHLEMKKINK